MKKILQTLAAIFCIGIASVYAQSVPLIGEPASIAPLLSNVPNISSNSERVNCQNDTVNYTWEKNVRPGTVLGFRIQDSIGWPSTLFQWFDAAQPITVSGVFYVAAAAPNQTLPLTVSIFNARADSMPTGPPLASTTVSTTSAVSWKLANFPTPVTVTGPYVITFSNGGTTTETRIILYSTYQNTNFPNDSLSGRGENLPGGNWVNLGLNKLKNFYQQNLNSLVDVDFVVVPVVNYSLAADYSAPASTCTNANATLQSNSSANFSSRFYNVNAFNKHFRNTADETFKWNIPSGATFGSTANVTANTPGALNVKLEANLKGWSMNCGSEVTKAVTFDGPTVTLLINSLEVCHSASPIALMGGSPSPGTYSINAAAATTFTPSINNVGDNQIIYSHTDANGCTGTATGNIKVVDCTGVAEFSALSDVKLFPNPSKGIITVQTKTNATVVVMDALGAIVAESKSTNQSPSVNFDLSHLNNGMYFVRISTESATVTKKVNIIK
jgi:hypothetical protein